ncbi:uncharacterized protein A4U43_C03F1890 [Asparagus officinalis]|uniref:Uncharacterized protein n=1 Tax=Asparagus officinalis TaxID=4686 RepID=A0A5P1F758_ASPOF|nr:uncharacterized protein LOC109832685 [Asparagus officinalis]ONK74012.1 uncharacterized protein A4U43_C03F1890 [Asparagus officinalis]
MDSSDKGILGDVPCSGNTTALEGFGHESGCINSSSDRLLDESKGSLSKGKSKVLDTFPPYPPNSKQKFCPQISDEIHEDNAVNKTMENYHSGIKALFSASIPSQSKESDDVSTESDETLEENYKRDSATKNLIHMVKGHDAPISSSHHLNADHSASKENMVDAGGNLTQELSDNIGLAKPCSCSFCLKAAHMWMDLAFQDTRGRLTELQRSKKRAADQIFRLTQDSSKLSKPSKLEVDLMQHWNLIFSRTQNALVHEIAKTRSDLQARSKLMENCKRELESRSNISLDKPL